MSDSLRGWWNILEPSELYPSLSPQAHTPEDIIHLGRAGSLPGPSLHVLQRTPQQWPVLMS